MGGKSPHQFSWLNQVELWFAKIQRGVIARGVFTFADDLSRNSRSTFAPTPNQHCSLGRTQIPNGASK